MKKNISRKGRALKYAKLGLDVIPLHAIADGHCSCGSGVDCQRSGKHPRTSNGVKDATTGRRTIKAWWNRWPEANIGIATGRSSGIFVIDIDGDVGKASLERLQAEQGRLPKTVTVRTGKGRHYYFRCNGARVGNYVGKLGEGIDVRGDGGYVVAAGSIHVSGAEYRFVDQRGLDDIEVASAPEWLLGLVRKDSSNRTETEEANNDPIPEGKLDRAHSYADAARRRELERVAKAPMHQRNSTLNVAAFKLGQLVPYGILDRAVVTQKLAQVARDIGLDESEIEPTITSGLNAGRRYPRRLSFLKSHQHIRDVEPPRKSKDEVTSNSLSLARRIRTTRNGSQIALGGRRSTRQAADGWSLMESDGATMTSAKSLNWRRRPPALSPPSLRTFKATQPARSAVDLPNSR